MIDELYIHSLENGNRLKRLVPDHVGSIDVSGRRERDFFFITLSGFTSPGTVTKYQFDEQCGSEKGKYELWRNTPVKGMAGEGGFLAEQVSAVE